MKSRSIKRILLLLLTLSLILAACGAGGEDPSPEVTTLVYANLTQNGVDRQAVLQFNRTHKDVQIEVRNYFDEDGPNGKSGKDLLFTEIGAGKIPDIIDLGNSTANSCILPYQVLVHKGLLEDLWPYIESDPDLGREGVLEDPLKAAEINGGLYAVFNSVVISSLVGAESIVGERYSWTLEELQETFSAMPEGSTILEYYLNKYDMFFYLFRMTMNSYVDWETGECAFDSEQFRSALEFVNSFSDQEFSSDDYWEMNLESVDRLRQGYQMLSAEFAFSRPHELQLLDAYYGLGGRAAFIGYPTTNGETGSCFAIRGTKLAMSSACKDKESAWEFIRQLLLPEYDNIDAVMSSIDLGIPVNRSDYNLMKKYENKYLLEFEKSRSGGPIVKITQATTEDLQRYEDLIHHIDKIDLYDDKIYDIVYETVGPYFAGDRTLDDTVRLIENRVGLYLKEQM